VLVCEQGVLHIKVEFQIARLTRNENDVYGFFAEVFMPGNHSVLPWWYSFDPVVTIIISHGEEWMFKDTYIGSLPGMVIVSEPNEHLGFGERLVQNRGAGSL